MFVTSAWVSAGVVSGGPLAPHALQEWAESQESEGHVFLPLEPAFFCLCVAPCCCFLFFLAVGTSRLVFYLFGLGQEGGLLLGRCFCCWGGGKGG